MERNALLTKIAGRHMPDADKIIIDFSKPISPDELREVIESLKKSGPSNLEYFLEKETLYLHIVKTLPTERKEWNLSKEMIEYFSFFGEHNYLLARVRAGDCKNIPMEKSLEELDDGIYFRLPDKICKKDVQRYFSKRFKPKDWSEHDVSLAVSYLAKDKAHYSDFVNWNRLPQDLKQYFKQKVLEEYIAQLRKEAEQGNKQRFEELGRVLLDDGMTSSCTSNGERVIVLQTSTNINPYTSIIELEKRLYDKLGKEAQLNYNSSCRQETQM